MSASAVRDILKLRGATAPSKLGNQLTKKRPEWSSTFRRCYECLENNKGQWMGLGDIAQATGLNIQSVYKCAGHFWAHCQLGALERREVANPRGGLPITQYRTKVTN